MLVDDDIYTKPDCSPVCNHREVCSRCGRPHCIKSMQHSRLHGYICYCGSSEYEPVIKFPRAIVIEQKMPHCKRCGHIVKQEAFGFSCSTCDSLLFGDAVEWKVPTIGAA